MADDHRNSLENPLIVNVDLKAYPLDIVQSVAYWYTEKYFVQLEHKSDQILEVSFKRKSAGNSGLQVEQFMNDLLDQTLRQKVAKESEPLRNLIIAHALSKTSLIDPKATPSLDGKANI